jgi:serine/threonine protein kinase
MPLDPFLQTLVDAVQGSARFDGRFHSPVLVNYDAAANQLRGCFSLVFRAIDDLTGEPVALKFFNPLGLGDVYRLNAFHREHEILKSLAGESRCLQLASGLNKFPLPVVTPAGTGSLPCEYFAIDWIDEDIDQYFLAQQSFSAPDKLAVLSDIIKAVQALHWKGVFHRDLKYDNFRAKQRDGRRIIIPIDMGAAARFASAPIQGAYALPAGAPYHSAPEARSGLAGNRLLASFTDVYAVGCMLFELFNKDYFYNANLFVNAHAQLHLAAMAAHLDLRADERSQRAAWDAAMNKLSRAFAPVKIDGAGSNVPAGIAPLLNELLAELTHVDYRKRPTLDRAQRRLNSARTVLKNEREYQARLARAREMRRRRLLAIAAREQRAIQAQLRAKGDIHAIS